jgi:catechol 2,3-dioxygenase-like lactoylglutathione lyase family enzyme
MQLSKAELDVGIATLAADQALAFYRDVLGLTELPPLAMGELGTQHRLRVGGHVLKLYDFTQRPEASEGGTDKAIGMRLLAFVLDDLPAVLARFDAAGHAYRTLSVPEETPYRVAFANDADGNALELVGLRKPAGDKLTARLQVGLTVSDIARSRHFYGELMGFAEQPEMRLPSSMGVVGNVRYGFTAGASTIKFWSRGELPVRTGAPAKRTGIRLMTAWVDDVDAAHALLRSRGVTIKVAPNDLGGLARVMFLADPDGNWIELARPLRG